MNDFPISLVTAQIPYIGLAHGFIGIMLFRFKNSNRDNLNSICLATALIFLTEVLFVNTTEIIGLVTWFISGLGLLIFYGMRFKRKPGKETMDYLKLIAIVLVALYPINFYTYNWYVAGWDILIALGYLIVPISGTIYLYDRWILKPEKMKSRFVTVLVIQTLLILISLAFGFIKSVKTDRMTELADKNAKEAMELAEALKNCQ